MHSGESTNSIILAIDTATSAISLALHNGTEVLAEMTWRAPGHHTMELSPAVQEILNRAGVRPPDLRAIAVALGPGSYTGLRIGMSLAKGIALTCNPPIALIGIPTLDITVSAQPHLSPRLCAVSHAGRGRFNAGFYQWENKGWMSKESPILASWSELAKHFELPIQVCGEIDSIGREILSSLGDQIIISEPAQGLRRAGFLAQLAHQRLAVGQLDDPATLAPIYHH
jgi:tRNA threonylcarbamoyladenosine biosynthesis protein TsaB